MPSRTLRTLLSALFACALVSFTLSTVAFGQTESVLYNFAAGSDGAGPFGNLVFDGAGNLYGTTDAGGLNNGNGGYGTVFELSPAGAGVWTETQLYVFTGGVDGQNPFGGVVFDPAGNLYSTTNFGGTHNAGTVFELSPVAGGGWSKQTLYSFAGGTDAAGPNGGLVIDAAGNLYGSSYQGGAQNLGAVFELSPTSGGGWSESVILSGSASRGSYFSDVPAFDNHGNLYIPARTGGPSNAGSIYRLTPSSTGWHSGVIYSFLGGADGQGPIAALRFQTPGRLFGTTQVGGAHDFGTAFELTASTGGLWTKTILWNFGASSTDGLYPGVALTFGPSGQLYGTTGSGGAFGSGTAFELVKLAAGWRERILYSFGLNLGGPAGSVVLDGSGNLYGLSHNQGTAGAGGAWEIIP